MAIDNKVMSETVYIPHSTVVSNGKYVSYLTDFVTCMASRRPLHKHYSFTRVFEENWIPNSCIWKVS